MKLLTFFLSALLWLVPLCAKTAEPVTFTRVTYPGDSYLYSVSHMADPTIRFATYSQTKSQVTVILLDGDLHEKDRFTISKPKDYSWIDMLEDVAHEEYICEYLVTQHLFNKDNEYEVILRCQIEHPEWTEEVFRIYNSRGERLGTVPSNGYGSNPSLFMYDDKSYIYFTGEDSDGISRTFLYAVGANADVKTLSEALPRLQVSPNPVAAGEQVNVAFAPMKGDGKLIVTDTNGMQLMFVKIAKGDTQVSFPADRLSVGINIMSLYSGAAEVISTAKIMRR